MVRAFIAVDFTDKQLIGNLNTIQTELSETSAKLTLVNVSLLHITLEFLGDISPSQVQDIIMILDRLYFSPLHFTVQSLGLLPSNNYVKVIYCKILGDIEPLKSLHSSLRKQLKNSDFTVDTRAFHPHLTIARVKHPGNKKELLQKVSENTEKVFGEQHINSIKLKHSELRPQGPVYRTLYERFAPCDKNDT